MTNIISKSNEMITFVLYLELV